MNYNNIRIGIFLATRELKHTAIATNLLIIFVMTLTFLNLMVLRGILIGIPEGATNAYREKYSSDVIISALQGEKYILRSKEVLDIIKNTPEATAYSSRILSGGTITSDPDARLSASEKPDIVNANIAGIIPTNEDNLTGLSENIIAGRYLLEKDTDGVLIGANLLTDYSSVQGVGEETLENVNIGKKINIKVGSISKDFIVVGILKSKVSQVERRVFMTQSTIRGLIDRDDSRYDEIAVHTNPNHTPEELKKALETNGITRYAKIQTFLESQPQFLDDIKGTFSILGDLVGTVGLIVASITIFIVIFVNAITKKKYIGILKGIGITNEAIEISYIVQSIFYALAGSFIGISILYIWIVPFFEKNPIPFPFADGILLAAPEDTIVRVTILCFATIIAGYVPARLIVKQNTLNSILGR